MRKNVLIKVYDGSDNFLKIWKDAQFESFTKEINGGVGECVIKLGKKFDYGGSDLKLGNNVEILISDKDVITDPVATGNRWRTIYKGFISLITAFVDGKKEGIEVHLLGHQVKLALDILKNGTTTTLYPDATNGLTVTSPGSATDLGKVMRGIIDRYRAETTSPKINYDTLSIALTSSNMGSNAITRFVRMTYKDAMEAVKQLSPANWFYYIDENGKVWFKTPPTTPTHKFIFGKHFKKVYIEKSAEKMRNTLLLWNGETSGGIYKLYSDAGLISQYGRRVEIYDNWSIGLSAEADLIGTKFLAENKNPEVRVTCEIVDNNENTESKGYDIENIQPGDTCVFFGFDDKINDFLRENMLISKVVYYLDKVEITVEAIPSGLVSWQEQTKKRTDEISNANDTGVPASYTT